MSTQDIIDKAVGLMDLHLTQIKTQATFLTKDGAKGFTTYDSQVIERYTKLLMAMQKGTEAATDDFDTMTDEQLQEEALKVLGDPNATETSDTE